MKADLELEYLPLPSLGTLHSRPVVSVQIEDLVEAPLACLVDSGAVYNRFPIEFANEAGINLDEPDMTDVFWAGGVKYEGAIVTVRLKIGALEWEAPVCFVPDWSQDFGLLGHEGFFRWFHVCFHAAEERISLEMVGQ
ncbi:MAG TPA: aspartyl protease family protein [Streptosporangiaceae bacterium]|nr:aspartyl protease family protein [Streptosporangiaceae bacterium]